MAFKGGYKLIDFGGVDITSQGATIEGLSDAIENNYGKQTVLTGVVIDGTEYIDFPATFVSSGSSNFVSILGSIAESPTSDSISVYVLTVTAGDFVTFAEKTITVA